MKGCISQLIFRKTVICYQCVELTVTSAFALLLLNIDTAEVQQSDQTQHSQN